ncbi:peptide/nickel transport system permease protein [Fictibacillus solisalsi]|uniref:Peptide/nickel transport system permease protein n=1 Tax=Fictibacillus solisalsi TaxID=459525 RepID=A0A1G9TE23_9BACL|nr:ABC transporter permease [Fictibacillus solisalsi]SDM45946.1 peptide/nickel transport system permease protein [Fictibacillus solisalsi]
MLEKASHDSLFRPLEKGRLKKEEIRRPGVSQAKESFRRVLKNKLAVTGAIILLLILFFAIFGPRMVPYSYSDQSLASGNLSPDGKHWFGTDDLGRDMWARTWYGARISLTIGVAAALIDLVVGLLVGGISGYMAGRGKLGDRIDNGLMRIVEILYSIPYLLVVILLLVVMKPGLWTIVIALSITGWVSMARVVRGQILQIKQQEFVAAAQKLGTPHGAIILKHLFPNMLGIIIVNLTFTIPNAIFAEAFLSFIGLGVQAPIASWGTMANDALGVILSGQWWRLFFPGFMISLTMFAFNVFGDGLQDALDPHQAKD